LYPFFPCAPPLSFEPTGHDFPHFLHFLHAPALFDLGQQDYFSHSLLFPRTPFLSHLDQQIMTASHTLYISYTPQVCSLVPITKNFLTHPFFSTFHTTTLSLLQNIFHAHNLLHLHYSDPSSPPFTKSCFSTSHLVYSL